MKKKNLITLCIIFITLALVLSFIFKFHKNSIIKNEDNNKTTAILKNSSNGDISNNNNLDDNKTILQQKDDNNDSLIIVDNSTDKNTNINKEKKEEKSLIEDKYKKIEWEELIPKDWDAEKIIDKIFKGIKIEDISEDEEFSGDDKKIDKAIKELRKVLDNAPVKDSMNGKYIKIVGYIAPLEYTESRTIKEFFLVPYFGGCIHSPPPPANQIIYVKSKNGIDLDLMQETVIVSGKLEIKRVPKKDMGVAGYFMQLDNIEIYKDK